MENFPSKSDHPKFKIQNLRVRNPNFEFRIQDSEFRMKDSGLKINIEILNSAFQIPDSKP